jgi:DICT domain-containing protein/GAF domain-containing protein
MLIRQSLLDDLTAALPQIRLQMYFKSSLTALSHAMEDQVLASGDAPLVIASFQRERFYRQEAHRYLRISEQTAQVYVLAAPEADFINQSEHYETIAFDPGDALASEWHLVVLGKNYASCLVCREVSPTRKTPASELHVDQSRRFEGLWTFDRTIVWRAAELMLQRVVQYRPELAAKVAKGLIPLQDPGISAVDPGPFAERLVTYLQVGQYKLSKAYRHLAEKERKERMVNAVTSAVRQSLNLDDILQSAATELGQVLAASRCLIYRCHAGDTLAPIQFEYLAPTEKTKPLTSLVGQIWDLAQNPLFTTAIDRQTPLYISNTKVPPDWITPIKSFQTLAKSGKIGAWLMVPLFYQDHLLGMVELHFRDEHSLPKSELELVEAIATQVSIALIQAEAYAHLADLNQQLEALDRTRSNLIAITGHELRTPLSTIQVCLESLASDLDMSLEMRQIMLTTALSDAERMRKLIKDFLTLSRLESGRIEWRLEPLTLQDNLDLALSSLRTRYGAAMPQVAAALDPQLPLVRGDGEWLVEVFVKLLDNACKFTGPKGRITVETQSGPSLQTLEVIIADTGCGIEISRLETVFERFYQEEGSLRRSNGGTGLGLAICRQIIAAWGGQIWATSLGKDQGSQLHFTLPMMPNAIQGSKVMRGRKGSTRSA